MNDKIELLLDESRGIYLPQGFVKCFDASEWGVDFEDADVLEEGPDHPDYWEVWDTILETASYTDEEGHKWTLWHDGYLFAIRDDMTEEEWAEFIG